MGRNDRFNLNSLLPLFMTNEQSTPTRSLRSAPLWATLCAAFALTACASLGGNKPEEQVRLRANGRWQALVAGDFPRAYTYNTAAFRAVVTPEAFRTRFGSAVTWVGAEATEVNCTEPAKCIAKVRIDFKPILGGRPGEKISTYYDETWLLEEGKWWIFLPIKGI